MKEVQFCPKSRSLEIEQSQETFRIGCTKVSFDEFIHSISEYSTDFLH
jgi:hypothetical protein